MGRLTGCPRVRPGPFVCPPRGSPLPKEAAVKEGGRGRGGGEGRYQLSRGWERRKGWRAEAEPEVRPELPEKARRKTRRKETHPAPILAPTLECLPLTTEGTASGRGDRSR